MHYYNPNDRRPRRWALISALIYALVLGVSFSVVNFDFNANIEQNNEIVIDFTEPPTPEPPRPPAKPTVQPREHDVVDPVEQTQQVTGTDEKTQTVNQKALFKMNKGGADEPDNVGNPRAEEGEEDKASGTGGGLNPDGFDQLDQGLQGRGLIGSLPRPRQPDNLSGIVVVFVRVDAKGNVTSATFEQRGSTVPPGNPLVQAAIAAAKQARFTENSAPIQGGRITYEFKLD